MQIEKTPIKDLLIIIPKVFEDDRGFFMESYSKKVFQQMGLNFEFIQDNHAKSTSGVLRGLHYQKEPMSQTKLVRVTKGSVYDVAIDLRESSVTFGKWFGVELSEHNKKMFLIPKGFAHGYCTLEEGTEFIYKVDNFYAPEQEDGILWNDTYLNIDWPIDNPIVSDKDKRLQSFLKLERCFE